MTLADKENASANVGLSGLKPPSILANKKLGLGPSTGMNRFGFKGGKKGKKTMLKLPSTSVRKFGTSIINTDNPTPVKAPTLAKTTPCQDTSALTNDSTTNRTPSIATPNFPNSPNSPNFPNSPNSPNNAPSSPLLLDALDDLEEIGTLLEMDPHLLVPSSDAVVDNNARLRDVFTTPNPKKEHNQSFSSAKSFVFKSPFKDDEGNINELEIEADFSSKADAIVTAMGDLTTLYPISIDRTDSTNDVTNHNSTDSTTTHEHTDKTDNKGLENDTGEGLINETGEGLMNETGEGLGNDIGEGLENGTGEGLENETGEGLENESEAAIGVDQQQLQETPSKETERALNSPESLCNASPPPSVEKVDIPKSTFLTNKIAALDARATSLANQREEYFDKIQKIYRLCFPVLNPVDTSNVVGNKDNTDDDFSEVDKELAQKLWGCLSKP